ncbi:MAG TPA: nucleotidyltransferase family protein [Rhodobacteraceae bacterium]|nr:nucleotidyltransferase family protein [Paracoccaceae bacterium]
MTIPILILAAGASTRMKGRDKLLEDVHGRPLLRHVTRRAVTTGCPVMVALPAGNQTRRKLLEGLDVTILEVMDAKSGMAASLRAGLSILPDEASGLLVALADMPDVTTDDYLSLIKAFLNDLEDSIHRASSADGTAGNPVLLPRWALTDPSVFTGDAGARHLLRQHAKRVRLVPLPDSHATTDLDTPQDWVAWRNQN